MIPRVSVIIPTYNCAEYLGIAVKSVLAQTFEDFELLVLDNASTDPTPEVMRQYRDSRLTYVRNSSNLGFRGNVLLGLERAQGPLLTYLNADDVWEQEFLQRAVPCMETSPEVCLIHTAALLIDDAGRPFGQSTNGWSRINSSPTAFLDCFRRGFCSSSMLMRSAAAKRFGGSEPKWGDFIDLLLFLRLSLEGDVIYLSDPLVRYRVHQESLTANMTRQGEVFRMHLKCAEWAFAWPQVQQLQLHRQQHFARRAIVIDSLKALHLLRVKGSRREFLRSFFDIAAFAPQVWLFPSMWGRLIFGLLPSEAILALQRWKRQSWRNVPLSLFFLSALFLRLAG